MGLIEGSPENPQTSHHNRIEGFEEGSQLCLHYAERRQPLGHSMEFFTSLIVGKDTETFGVFSVDFIVVDFSSKLIIFIGRSIVKLWISIGSKDALIFLFFHALIQTNVRLDPNQ